jgi:hypothetical protein
VKSTSNNKQQMKKAFTIIAVAVVATAFVACGPSAEEKAKMEERAKQIQDSIATSISESMQTEAAADSTAAAPATTETTTATESHEGHNH